MRISDWSSDVCSSDLARRPGGSRGHGPPLLLVGHQVPLVDAHRSAPSSLMTSGTSDTRSRVTTSVFQPFSVIIWSAVAARCRLLNGPAAMDVSMNGEEIGRAHV